MEGEPAVQLIIRDVSERIRMKEEVERSQRLDAIGRATSGVVHDFNNLLQTARISAEILLRKLGRDGEHAATLNDIVSVTEEGAALTKQLLVFARQGSLDRKEVDLNRVITEVEQILRHVVGKACDLQVKLSDEPLPVEGDPTQIVQVLTNLVVNARDALEGKGSVRLTTQWITAEGSPPALNGRSAALLTVEDDGMGMDRETLAHIFEPFFTTKDEKGTGLGLSVTHGIVQSHGGTITVESRPGVGTTFKVYFPTLE